VYLGPERMTDIQWLRSGAVGHTEDERECWYADYRVQHLLDPLCPADTLRMLVMIRPTKSTDEAYAVEGPDPNEPPDQPDQTAGRGDRDRTDADGPPELVSVRSGLYPVPQHLDADFDGSFVAPTVREYLWTPVGQPDHDLAVALAYLDQAKSASGQPLPDVTPEVRESLASVWWRFQPRANCFPSGDGVEGLDVQDDKFHGGDFHKAFEFRLPCCCPPAPK
jgi:hypothetical protein